MPLPRRREIDRVVYPISDDMGEHELQTLMREMLRPMLAQFLADRARGDVHVGSDQFIYWEEGNREACVAPDIYVLPGVSSQRVVSTWKTWEEGNVVPSLAIEIVTGDVEEDYEDAPRRYRELGVRELVVYDTRVAPAPRRIRRFRFQLFRRIGGTFRRVLATNDDRIRSRVIGAWLRATGDGDAKRLRLATGARGEVLVPTMEERVRQLEADLREARSAKPKRGR